MDHPTGATAPLTHQDAPRDGGALAQQAVTLSLPLGTRQNDESVEHVEATPVEVSRQGSGSYLLTSMPVGAGIGLGDTVKVKALKPTGELVIRSVVQRSPRYTMNFAFDVPSHADQAGDHVQSWADAVDERAHADGASTAHSESWHVVALPESVTTAAQALAWCDALAQAAFLSLPIACQERLSQDGVTVLWSFHSVPSYGPGAAPGLAKTSPSAPDPGRDPGTAAHLEQGTLARQIAAVERALEKATRKGAASPEPSALAEWAQAGVPSALATYTWGCMLTGHFDRALMQATWSVDACEHLVELCQAGDDHQLAEQQSLSLLNAWANIALSREALGDDSAAAARAWASADGMIETVMVPVIRSFREGDAVAARRALYVLDDMNEGAIESIQSYLRAAAKEATGWLRAWAKDGLKVVGSLRKKERAEVLEQHARQYLDYLTAQPVGIGDGNLAATLVCRKAGDLYLGGAGFSVLDPADPFQQYLSISTGFDCWASTATLHASEGTDEVLAVLVTTYGPWTASREGRLIVDLLEQAPEGSLLPPGLLLHGIERAFAVDFTAYPPKALTGERDPDSAGPLGSIGSLLVAADTLPYEMVDDYLADEDEGPMTESFALSGCLWCYCLVPFEEGQDDDPTDLQGGWLDLPVLFTNDAGRQALGLP